MAQGLGLSLPNRGVLFGATTADGLVNLAERADRFAGLDWKIGPGGVPLLTDALATLECEIVAEHPTGDHWIVVGQVNVLQVSHSKDPLIFFASAYRALR